MGALPSQVAWAPQNLADAIAQRLSIVTNGTYLLPVGGSTAPLFNAGPWLKNDVEWWVWSNSAGAYVPITVNQQSLKYAVGPDAPDPTKYLFWIELAAGGSPLALKTYYSGNWVDVYATTLANYSTTAQMNAAIAAATTPYAARANPSINQTVNITGAAVKINFATENFDPQGVYNAGTSTYTVPEDGIYQVGCHLQVDNGTGTASGMELSLQAYVNGGPEMSSGMAIASPPGSRWYPQLTSIVDVSAGGTIEIYLSATDGVDTGNVVVSTNSWFYVYKVGDL